MSMRSSRSSAYSRPLPRSAWRNPGPTLTYIAAPVLAYALAIAFAGLFALQFFEDTHGGKLILLAALTLVLLLAAIAHGLSTGNRGALWLGYIGFSAEILTLYGVTVGTILGTSLFFLIAAVIVALLRMRPCDWHGKARARKTRHDRQPDIPVAAARRALR